MSWNVLCSASAALVLSFFGEYGELAFIPAPLSQGTALLSVTVCGALPNNSNRKTGW